MRALNDERGAVAVFVAVLTLVIMGCGAIVLDVGALYQERRELQSGADAAALAVAQDCAVDTCDPSTAPGGTADTYGDANALDGDSNIAEICGVGPGLPDVPCTNPPDIPENAKGWVQVTTSTRDAYRNLNRISFGFARVLGHEGNTLVARTTVAWGSAGGMATAPLMFSACEYFAQVENIGFAPGPPYDVEANAPYWTRVYFGADSGGGNYVPEGCDDNPANQDQPGGFGWLDTDSNDGESTTCLAYTSEDGTMDADTGTNVVKDDGEYCYPKVGEVNFFPYYYLSSGTGSGAEYEVADYGAFYVTGYSFGGNKSHTAPEGFTCEDAELGAKKNSSCIGGYFVKATAPATSFGTGSLDGAVAVMIVG
jgi:hypothetical protein